MKITFEGRDWEFDESEITVKQGVAIHLAHGITIAQFSQGLIDMDARALQAGYWLMLQQNDVVKPIAACDFRAVAFAEAYANGRLADMEAEKAKQAEAAAAAAAVPVVPTIPGGTGEAAWPGPGYQATTTPQPQQPEPLQRPPDPTGY